MEIPQIEAGVIGDAFEQSYDELEILPWRHQRILSGQHHQGKPYSPASITTKAPPQGLRENSKAYVKTLEGPHREKRTPAIILSGQQHQGKPHSSAHSLALTHTLTPLCRAFPACTKSRYEKQKQPLPDVWEQDSER